MIDKNYDHINSEPYIYKKWEESGAFSPPPGKELDPTRKTFTVIMPPPNANDPLHMGHAMFVTIEDIYVRFHRMLGDATLWLPGTDHAGIETQFVFEKKLAKQGKSRFDFERDVLYKMISEYVSLNSGVAIDQMKKLGASADWSRYKFTLDPEVIDQVLNTFLVLNERGLVYKAEKLVNYCTKCGTAYSDLEIEYEEKNDQIYTIDYGNGINVATTRPETMLGDVAVAVHPGDERYQSMIGKTIKLPLTDREIPVIADTMVDMEFGTGAVKITPTHDHNDWSVAERQKMNLSEICSRFKIIGENGKMTASSGKYVGMNVLAAREKVLTDLGNKVVNVKPIIHNVSVCYRCKRTLEPLPRSQFFIKVKNMADKVLNALNKNEVEVFGSGHDKILRHWLENLHDWNISRQIVWGIRMPVWYKLDNIGGSDFVVSKEKPVGDYVQETDTFDTWFSSGQWPVVTLKTNKEGDFDRYYPTSLMETGHDILPFWVMRMLMLGLEITGEVPFKKVYLHGLIRDEKGEKMSKSKGNVINPLELSEKYGTDALRMALIMSTTAGMDSNTGENKVRGMRNFANKIWNAYRYITEKPPLDTEDCENDKAFEQKIAMTSREISDNLLNYKPGLAAELIYSDFWHYFCDVAIEESKKGLISDKTLKNGLLVYLKLLHPFVPFVTEKVWQDMNLTDRMLIESPWPTN